MPLIDGKFEPLVLPSTKHARVLCDPGRMVNGELVPWRFRVLQQVVAIKIVGVNA